MKTALTSCLSKEAGLQTMWVVFKAKDLKGKIYQTVALHKTSSNLSIILQLMDVFADVAVWNGAGLTSLTPG